MIKKNFSLSVCILLCALMSIWPLSSKGERVVNVANAGTLSTLLKQSGSELKLKGKLNGTDVKYLRELINNGGVVAIDLSEVHIVSGGEAYLDSLKTEDDAIGQDMFKDCRNLHRIVLPNTLRSIGTTAFSHSGLRKIDIPNSVCRIGRDAFANCRSLDTVIIGSRVTALDQGVFYRSNVKQAYIKRVTPPSIGNYLFTSNPNVCVYSSALEDYSESSWSNFCSLTGGLEKRYPQKEDKTTAMVNQKLAIFFEDAACTKLRAQYIAMNDKKLMAAMKKAKMPAFMRNLALKLKNNGWAAYEQDFRIYDYKAFSDANYWNNKLRSTGGSYMGNPTGIWTSGYDTLYVFVDSDVPADATLYLAGCVKNDLLSDAKCGQKLVKGLNIVEGQKDALYYIIYTADTRSQTKTLSEWPKIKIHIEGGIVNGYYDVARKSDSDYRALLAGATHELFTVKSDEALFNFKTESYKSVWPETIDKAICWFDSVTVWEKEIMGYCESVVNGQRAQAPYNLTGGESIFPIYYNNPNFAIEGKESDAGWANSTLYRTSYNSLRCISASFDVTLPNHDDWCAGHECGHNNQKAINLEAATESSNNLFSNAVRYLTGNATSKGAALSSVMDEYTRNAPFVLRSGNSMMHMYYQLYLYYHLGRKNTSFYPNFFKALREDPLELWGSSDSSILKFARKACEVAQEDLTDFFAAYGFFEAYDERTIGDYGSHSSYSKQEDIDRTLAEISKYPKNRAILFVEDRVDYVLTNGYLSPAGQKRRDSDQVGQCGDLGQFTDYLDENFKPSKYTYVQADSLYAMTGEGGVGFIVLDAEDKMLFASNAKTFRIPTSISTDFKIYSVDADGTLHEAVKSGNGGVEVVSLAKAGTLADNISASVLKATISGDINGTDIKQMRELMEKGSLTVLDISNINIVEGGDNYYKDYSSELGIIGGYAFHGCKKLIAARLPKTITKIGTNAFSRTGLNMIVVPDNVDTLGGDAFAYCDALSQVVIGQGVKKLEKGVFYNSHVKDVYVKALTPPTLGTYIFTSKPTIHVPASALEDYNNSDWAKFGTIVGDLDEQDISSICQ